MPPVYRVDDGRAILGTMGGGYGLGLSDLSLILADPRISTAAPGQEQRRSLVDLAHHFRGASPDGGADQFHRGGAVTGV